MLLIGRLLILFASRLLLSFRRRPQTLFLLLQGNAELSLMTSNYSVIRAVVIVAEHLFEGESCVLHPNPPSSSVLVQIAPAKDVETKMQVHGRMLTGEWATAHF